ncbi:MAG: serine hydrolase domain-containing protein [Christensenellales bacterium]|jgi:CubicO group peptidase (beta-lactamase class C family)
MSNFDRVERYLKDYFIDELGIPCCGLVVRRAHETVFRAFYGYSDGARRIPSSGDTLYFLYSCSKPITVAAAMRLVEEGALGLDFPVHQYLPEFRGVYLLRDGQRIRPRTVMTVRHLFTMSAGFNYELDREPLRALLRKNGGHATTREIVAALVESPLCFEPGERYQYSLCHDVLAAVVEAASGERFSDFLRRVIFEPLGMKNTSMRHAGDPVTLAAQYCYNADERNMREAPPTNQFALSPEYESGGAGIVSSADDYSLFVDAMANGGVGLSGARILSAETIDIMRTEQLSRVASVQNFSSAGGPGYGYGLGVRTLISRDCGRRNALGSFGWDGAAGSYMLADPENRLSIAYTMHVRGWTALIGDHAALCNRIYEALDL